MVKKLIMLLVVGLLLASGVSIYPQKGLAAINYSGGYLDGQAISLGSDQNTPITPTYSMTDNNEATSVTMSKWVSSGSTDLDHAIKTYSTAITVNAFRVKAAAGMQLYFYDGSNNNILVNGIGVIVIPATQTDGSLVMIPATSGIRKVVLFNPSTTTSVSVTELQIYNISTPVAPLISASSGNSIVDLTWNYVASATGYNIKRSLTPNGPYTTIVSNLAATSFSDNDVINGTTYYYVVTAVNPIGESVNSNEAEATPTVDVPDAPTNLTATGDNELQAINLNWSSVIGATYYDVKRSTAAGGPYSTVASNLTGTAYIDSDVVPGTPYYYIVTAINEGMASGSSNEASAELEGIDLGRAILTVYISGGQIKEYDLSATQLSAFIDWYDTKDAGTGPAKYKFVKTWNKGPFKARAEYVVFDKILTFNVDEYDVVTP
jgi:hypothetical protein